MIACNHVFLTNGWWRLRSLCKPEAAATVARYAVCAILAILIVHAGLGLLRALQPPPTPESSLPAKSTSTTARRPHDALALAKQIAAQHLFGAAVAPNAPTTPDPVEKTSGRIKLVGTIYGGAEMPSLAIFQTEHSQRTYKAGDALPNGELLVAVRPNNVTLKGPQGQYSMALRHAEGSLLAEGEHFEIVPANGVTTVKLTGPSPAADAPAAPPPAAMPTLQRLKTLRMRLLGGG